MGMGEHFRFHLVRGWEYGSGVDGDPGRSIDVTILHGYQQLRTVQALAIRM